MKVRGGDEERDYLVGVCVLGAYLAYTYGFSSGCSGAGTLQFSHTFPQGCRYFAWLLQKITSARGFNARPVRTPGWTGYDLPAERPFAGSGVYAEMSPL